jgi:predicted nucleotidyltransferase
MRTTAESQPIAAALFGKTRRAILALLYSHPDEEFYFREIIRLVGAGRGAVARELENLTLAGILVKKKKGRQIYYRSNQRCPVYPELRGLIVKTAGMADVLSTALAPLAKKIRLAFIYGSVARLDERSTSDIDLMIVGELGIRDVVRALRPAHETLRRVINPSVFSYEEFLDRLNSGDPFIRTVWDGRKIMLAGDESDLKGLGG